MTSTDWRGRPQATLVLRRGELVLLIGAALWSCLWSAYFVAASSAGAPEPMWTPASLLVALGLLGITTLLRLGRRRATSSYRVEEGQLIVQGPSGDDISVLSLERIGATGIQNHGGGLGTVWVQVGATVTPMLHRIQDPQDAAAALSGPPTASSLASSEDDGHTD